MKIVEPVCRNSERLCVGDVVVDKDGKGYLVVKQADGKYMAISFDGKGTLNGVYDTLMDMNDWYYIHGFYENCVIYRKEDHQLKIIST